jgi:cytochrome c oxidase assembly protein Cox11
VQLFLGVFALLVSNTAGSLASRLAGGLAFAAAAVLYALCEVTGFKGTDSLHDDISFDKKD